MLNLLTSLILSQLKMWQCAPEVWLALSTEPYSCPTACARECRLNQAWSQGTGPGSSSITAQTAQNPSRMQLPTCSSEDGPQSKGCACSGVFRKSIITDQCRSDCSCLRVPCKLVRKLDTNRLSSANKWFLPPPLSPPDQVTGSPQEPSELTHCSCTGMGNPRPRACQ